ncbi:hypothetical protein [uncultured Draconibacterium sp.]|uniref:hypothetical protein n=1 Tax=uncultured Draconibacterium sp. TaxID=1573823 RepID=UPI00325FE40C
MWHRLRDLRGKLKWQCPGKFYGKLCTSDLTANVGPDYSSASGTLSFPAGSEDGDTQTFNVFNQQRPGS